MLSEKFNKPQLAIEEHVISWHGNSLENKRMAR